MFIYTYILYLQYIHLIHILIHRSCVRARRIQAASQYFWPNSWYRSSGLLYRIFGHGPFGSLTSLKRWVRCMVCKMYMWLTDWWVCIWYLGLCHEYYICAVPCMSHLFIAYYHIYILWLYMWCMYPYIWLYRTYRIYVIHIHGYRRTILTPLFWTP